MLSRMHVLFYRPLPLLSQDSRASLLINLDPSYHLGISHVVTPDVSFANAQAVQIDPLASSLQLTRTRIWFSAVPLSMYQQLQAALHLRLGGRLDLRFEENDEADSRASLPLSETGKNVHLQGGTTGSPSFEGITACFLDFTDRM